MSVQPWTWLAETTILQDRWIDLRRERVRTASGAEIDDFYVLHYPDWVHAVAVTPEGRFVLTRQWRQGVRAVSLEFAGGVMDEGETAELTAARELLEETGYRGGAGALLQTLWANPVSHTNRVHTVLIEQAERVDGPKNDPFEALDVEVIEPAALMSELRAGRIGHPLHVAAAFAVLLHRPGLLERCG